MPIVILAGDMYQLPPVLASPLYADKVVIDEERKNKEYYDEMNLGLRLYKKFFDKAVVLNENKRQSDDPEWRDMLRRVRDGTATHDDAQRLALYVLSPEELTTDPSRDPSADPARVWQTCPRFYPKKKDIALENFNILCHEFPNPADRFDASSINKIGKTQITPETLATFGPKFAELGPSLPLAVGARVMVTENDESARQWGIINGTVGTVVGYLSADRGRTITHILFRPDHAMRNMPPFKFTVPNPDDPEGRPMDVSLPGTWPFPRIKNSFKVQQGADKTRLVTVATERFPLMLAYAMTIHKAQGITTSHAIVDVTECFEGQMAYVGLSRVKTLSGLRLRRRPRLSDLNKFARSKNKPLLEAEFARFETLQKSVIDRCRVFVEAEVER